jgi:predicted metal-dependent hydrolase
MPRRCPTLPLPSDDMEVEVIRSPRRRKTVQGRVVDGVAQVLIPARLSKAEETRMVAEMVATLERRQQTKPIDLAARAEVLAARHGLPQPASIRWADNQVWRWGSCTPVDRSIRISTRLGAFPRWVLDAVIVHELCHLVELRHNSAFWALANRFPKMERARGFLIAKGFEEDDDPDAAATPRHAPPRPDREPDREPSPIPSPKRAPKRQPSPELQPTLW